jgi:hypothetical protein
MSTCIDDFSANAANSSQSFDELEFMRKRMHEIGDELYEKSKMLAKAQAKILHLKMNLGFGSRRQKNRGHLRKCKKSNC